MRNNRLPYGSTVPDTWDAVPLKYLATLTNGYVFNSSERSETGTPIIRIENLNGSPHFNHSDLHLPNKYRVNHGDLLFSWSGNPGTSFGPYLWSNHGEHYLNQHIFKVGVFGCDSRWLYWALKAATHWIERELTSGMIGMVHVTKEDLSGVPIPIPPIEAQRRIADFLNAETARIDALASARERQLALLAERFLARIFDAVRGANESGSRKSSGLDWLGTIPSSWPVMSVSHQFEVLLGKMLNQERIQGTYLAPYLRNTNVQWDRIDTDDLLLMNFPPEERTRYSLRPGDLLVCEGGEPGRAAIWQGHTEKVYYQKALHRVRARAYSSPRWLFYCLRAATAQNVFAVEGNNTTIAHLTGEQFRAHRFPFPERMTQDRLTAKLDADNHTQQQLEKTLRKQLAVLAERRQALISAAVTGQFDVTTASGRNVTEGVSV
jgi:type I restriction enzyme S subunit